MFAYGEKVLLIDAKKRRYLFTLKVGGEFHTHSGFLSHGEVVGSQEGSVLRSTKGAEFIVLRPTLEDFVIQMPRGAQVIYPKDLAPICMMADIYPGAKVFESGLGSGALSMTMLRYGAIIDGYEIREDFANRAQTNVREFLGADSLSRYRVSVKDVYAGIDEVGFDRMVLDLPEPWQVVQHAEKSLRRGAILVAYSPSITQAVKTRETLGEGWLDHRTLEVLHRTWHIEGTSVRHDHLMVAHTGFLTSARFIGN
ncbi:MAG: tRNA (adenine-N1)-methyltransferase [Acidimicrobiaceae bacterium]